jgi:rod shape determining protein RodA
MQVGIERRMLPHVPWGMVIATLCTAALGIWNLVSASRPPHHPVWASQTVYLGVGIIAAIGVCLLDTRFIYRMAWPIYLANIGALLALKVVGHKIKGAQSWIALGPIHIEPAEYMKIGILLLLAKFYHDDFRAHEPSYGMLRLIKPVAIFLVPTLLVLVHPDLGDAMMLALSSVTIILFAKVRWRVIVVGVVGLAAVSLLIWNDYVRDPADGHKVYIRAVLKHHQSQRIAQWLDPTSDLKGAGYHAEQSRIAVGSGGVTGKGWMQGTQTGLFFLPEQHTDFIFSVWAEEHGFLACTLLLFLYGVMLTTALAVGFNARDRFAAFVAVGVASMLFWQIFENIGMVIGLLPVTGIPLPLMSYGGSAMVSVMLSLGLLANISMRRHVF